MEWRCQTAFSTRESGLGGEYEAGIETHPQLFAFLPGLGTSGLFKSQKGDFRVKHSLSLGQVVGLWGPGHSN